MIPRILYVQYNLALEKFISEMHHTGGPSIDMCTPVCLATFRERNIQTHFKVASSNPPSMASFTPYTYFQCPCTNTSTSAGRLGGSEAAEEGGSDDDERAFNPRAPRANYSLYPLEQLLYCEDCHQIRCPRCVLDEIVTWYCPYCLFEVPSSTVKSEGNRFVFI